MKKLYMLTYVTDDGKRHVQYYDDIEWCVFDYSQLKPQVRSAFWKEVSR